MVFRYCQWVFQPFLSIGGIQDLSVLCGSIYQQLSAFIQHNRIPLSCKNTSDVLLPVDMADYHIILGIILLQAEAYHQIPILYGRKHGISAGLCNEKHPGKQEPYCQCEKQDTQQETYTVLSYKNILSASADDFCNRLIFSILFHHQLSPFP